MSFFAPVIAASERRRARLLARSYQEDWRLALALAVAVAAVVFGFFTFASGASPDTWVPVVVVAFIVAVSVPLCLFVGRGDGRLKKLLVLALILKIAAVGPRYWVNEVYYGGEVDAPQYDAAGGVFIQEFAKGRWTIEPAPLAAFPPQTRFVGYVTGILYLAFGTSFVGGYFVFSWVAWLGLLCFFQSFRLAYPNAPPHRAAMLILFYPSLLFWPSSPGKEALMVFALGAAAYGITAVLHGRRWLGGLVLGALGLYLLYSVRPHLLLVVFAGVATALVARPRPGEQGRRLLWPVLLRLAVLVAIVPALLFGLTAVDDYLGDDTGTLDVTTTLDTTLESTGTGNSAFATQGVRSITDIPFALVSVPLRPFLFEARSPQLLISALEGTLLLVAGALSARWLWCFAPAIRRSPLAAYCLGFSVAFCIAFSNIANAGILSRQRVQLLPVLFLLACCARAHYDEQRTSLATPDPDAPAPDLVPVAAGAR